MFLVVALLMIDICWDTKIFAYVLRNINEFGTLMNTVNVLSSQHGVTSQKILFFRLIIINDLNKEKLKPIVMYTAKKKQTMYTSNYRSTLRGKAVLLAAWLKVPCFWGSFS